MVAAEFLQVEVEVTNSGIRLNILGRHYNISYPREVWDAVPSEMKLLLRDHLAYAAAVHLPMKIRELSGLIFSSARPLFEPHLLLNTIRDIPSCCDMDGADIARETERFLGLDFRFDSHEIRQPVYWPADYQENPAAVIPLSFGKDSLLTFALAEELGLNPRGVFVDEPGFPGERAHKEELGKLFREEFGHELEILHHDTGKLRDSDHLGIKADEYGWGLQSTEYALLMLPYARFLGAGYILFGNEQTAGESYRDTAERWNVYPCYDQSPEWTRQVDAMTTMLTEPHPVRTGSLIEPLMDMMVQRILVNRYPRYASLQMSCFAEGEEGKGYRWCHECSICAKMYLMCVGGGVDPASVGFRRSLLSSRERKYFSLFGGDGGFPYSRTGTARDEQLFAFSCAAKFGCEDELVKEFQNSESAVEARERESELLSRFTDIYPSITLPEELKDRVLQIYEEEIAGFLRLYHEAS